MPADVVVSFIAHRSALFFCERQDVLTTVMKPFVRLFAFFSFAAAAAAADLHPIVEVQSGYLFGAIGDGKWIKADETAKLIGDETTYRVYGLTQALGDAKGDKPKAVEDVCTDTLSVSLLPKPE